MVWDGYIYMQGGSSILSFLIKMSFQTDSTSHKLEITRSYIGDNGKTVVKLRYSWRYLVPTEFSDVKEMRTSEKIFFISVDFDKQEVTHPFVWPDLD